MRTVVTFAEFYRHEPLVLGSNRSRFDLLFNLHDDEVRLRRRWDLLVDDADFVLSVERDGPGWYIYTHSQSPLPRTKAALLCCSFRLESWIVSPEKDGLCVRAGQVVSFGFAPKWLEHEVRMMLTHEPGPLPSLAPTTPGRSLENLPSEVLRRVLSYLPTSTVVRTLPFVSKRFFNIVRSDIVCWKVLDLRTEFLCLKDLRSLFPVARETCLEVYLMNTHSDCRAWVQDDRLKEIYQFLLLECDWPLVQKLHISGTLNRLKKAWVKEALSVGNFPALQKLVWSQHFNEFSGKRLPPNLAFYELQGTRLSNLTHLVFDVRGESPNGVPRGHEIWKQCRALKSLHLRLKSCHWKGLFKDPEGLPCPLLQLEELKIIAPIGGNSLRRELAALVHCPVKRLMIGGSNRYEEYESDPDDFLYPDGCGGEILSYFPHLEALCLRGEVRMKFDSVQDSVQQNLKAFRGLMHRPDSIPFERMPNLEAVWLEVFLRERRNSDDEHQRYTNALLTAFTLPKLQALALGGFTLPDVLINHLPKFRNPSIVYLEAHFRIINDETCRGLKKILACMPNVQRLKIVAEECPMAPKNMASVVKVRGKNIAELVISTDLKLRRPDFYDGQVASLLEGLPGEWTLTRKPKSFLRQVAVFWRNGALKLPEKCYLFDDPFFDVYNLA